MALIFVTGGTGQIGRCLVNKLYEKHNVRLALRPYCDLEGDLELAKDCDYIIHLAAYNNPNGRYEDFYRTNVLATKNIMSLGIPTMYVSTTMVFTKKTDYYTTTKQEALKYVDSDKHCIIYPTTVIGFDSPKFNPLQMLIWKTIGRGISGGVSHLFGRADRLINYIFVNDLVEGMIDLMFKTGSHILGCENITAREYLNKMCKRKGVKPFPFRFPAHIEDMAYVTHNKTKERL